MTHRAVRLDRRFVWKEKANSNGVFEGYASTFGNEDHSGDIIMKGAFTKGLKELQDRGQKLKMLWNHDRMQPIGVFNKSAEDNSGLYVEGKLTLGVQRADELFLLMKDEAIDSMSIGGYVIDDRYNKENNTTQLFEVKLREISPVTFPDNDGARIVTVKALQECVTIRELENYLRDVGGFSAEVAKAIIAKAKGSVDMVRDAPDEAAQALKDAIKSLRNS